MRVKLQMPDKYDFTCDFVLRVTDMNYGNHLGNDRILVLAQEGRALFLKSIGCTEFDLFGASIIQADAAIVYKSEGYAGDLIKCHIKVENISRSSFDLMYLFENTTTGKTLVFCKTGMVCYDYKEKKVVGVPDRFVALFH